MFDFRFLISDFGFQSRIKSRLMDSWAYKLISLSAHKPISLSAHKPISLLAHKPISLLAHKPISLLAHKLIGLFLLSCLVPSALARDVGTSGSLALKIGIGAKSTSMGEATVAVADDISSIYWNPAGLVQIRDSQISAMHIEWLDDIRYEWVGFAQPLAPWVTVAADVFYVHMGSIPRTIESPTEGYEADGTFTAADMAGRFAVAGRIFKDVLVGASFQVFQSKVSFEDVIKERIGDKTARSTVIGLGCLYNTSIPNLSVGCSFQNWGRQTRVFIKEKEPLPFAFRLGVAYKALVAGWKVAPSQEGATANSGESAILSSAGALIMAMDLDFPIDSSVSVRMGAEYRFGGGIAVRGGYRTGTGFDFPSGLCVGAGYSSASYQVDYALVPYGDIGSTHRVSFTIRF